MSMHNGRSRTLHEHMAVTQYVYRLKPVGPHMRYVHEILARARELCPACAGSGRERARPTLLGQEPWIVDDRPGERLCPECEGTGGFWICSQESVEVLRQRILEVYPEAALEHSTARFMGHPLAYNYATGVVETEVLMPPAVIPSTPAARWTFNYRCG